jgi:hypothetical protein
MPGARNQNSARSMLAERQFTAHGSGHSFPPVAMCPATNTGAVLGAPNVAAGRA